MTPGIVSVTPFELVWNAENLTQPRDPAGAQQLFVIRPGENVSSIGQRLEQAGLIRNADTFRTYLLWTGADTTIQVGTFRLSPARSGREIADMLKSTTLTELIFNILPGWRMEEIAASLPTSGLEITPEEFLSAASAPAELPNLSPSVGLPKVSSTPANTPWHVPLRLNNWSRFYYKIPLRS